MNTIKDKHNVAFCMKFPKPTQQLLMDNIERIPGSVENIKHWANHKRSHNLTATLEEMDTYNKNDYNLVFSFSSKSKLTKGLEVPFNFKSIKEAIDSIDDKTVKTVRQKLNSLLQKAKKEAANSNKLNALANNKEFGRRFADNTSASLPYTDWNGDYIKKLVKNAPKEFSFKIERPQHGDYTLYVSSSKCPMAGYQKYNMKKQLRGKDEHYKADMLKFEETVLRPINKLERALNKEREAFKAAFFKPEKPRKLTTEDLQRVIIDEEKLEDIQFAPVTKGLQFSEDAQDLILTEKGITPEQVSKFTALANRESAKNLVLDISKRRGDRYVTILDVFQEEHPTGIRDKSEGFSEHIDNVLKQLEDTTIYETKAADLIKSAEISEAKYNQMIELTKTDAFKAKFAEGSDIHIKHSYNKLNIDKLKMLMENSEGFTFKLDDKSFSVAHKDYPDAGYHTISKEISDSVVDSLTPQKLNDIKEIDLKWHNQHNINIKQAKAQLKNIFETSNNKAKK